MHEMHCRIGTAVGTVALFLGILVGSVPAATAQTPAADEAEAEALREVERQRVSALVDADVDAAGPLHADDFQHINPIGVLFSKEMLLGAVGSGILDVVAWDIEEIEVRLYDDAAAIRYLAELEVTFQGTAEAPRGHWFTVVYELRDGNWQAVWSQTTFADGGAMEAATPAS